MLPVVLLGIFHNNSSVSNPVPETSPSALLSFTASNVRSYRDEVHLSLLATRLAREGVRRDIQTPSSSVPVGVLPAAGVFGANASGKTALLLALTDMREVVVSSFRRGTPSSGMYRVPFALEDDSRVQPSSFQIDLILNRVRWQYGFEINDERVLEEYAYHYPKGRQAKVFERTQDDISFGSPFRHSGHLLCRLLRNNALLLSVAGAADDEDLGPLFMWFVNNLRLARSENRSSRILYTAERIKRHVAKEQIMGLIHAADLGVVGIERIAVPSEVAEQIQIILRKLEDSSDIPETIDNNIKISFPDLVCLKHQGSTGSVVLNPELESEGTIVWVGLIGPVLEALENGLVFLCDELDTSLHPYLVSELVNMFQDPELNPRCAQLVFNAHDTNVLGDSSQEVLGRDQIWFTEKGNEGATILYPLADFRPRRDEALARRYLQGRFGAVPNINPAEIQTSLEPIRT
ncbi:AAA family ATPase [Candidatus Poriferisocius sp.]|uniref:AAA family ATPase n=1 Tax=Candidatus Poriferisocius sp. TaxID=3101276 RepID=UPI003B01B037